MDKARMYLRIQGMDEVMTKINYLIEDMEIQVEGYTRFWDENSGKSVGMSRNTSISTTRGDISHEIPQSAQSHGENAQRLASVSKPGNQRRITVDDILDESIEYISKDEAAVNKEPSYDIKAPKDPQEEDAKKSHVVNANETTT